MPCAGRGKNEEGKWLLVIRHYLLEGSGRVFNFNRCMNNRPRNLHKLMPKARSQRSVAGQHNYCLGEFSVCRNHEAACRLLLFGNDP
jgi:hypothetical protein